MDKKSYDNGSDFSFVETESPRSSDNYRKCGQNKQLSGTEPVNHKNGKQHPETISERASGEGWIS